MLLEVLILFYYDIFCKIDVHNALFIVTECSRRPLDSIDRNIRSLDRRSSTKKKRKVISATTVDMQRSYQDIHVCFTGTDHQRKFPKHNLIFHGITTGAEDGGVNNQHGVVGKSSPLSTRRQIKEGKKGGCYYVY